MSKVLTRQLAHARTTRCLPHCEDHDSTLMDWNGVALDAACGCRLDDSGFVSAKLLVSHIKRPIEKEVSDSDLLQKLGESLLWINLRGKLVTLLQRQVDDGDANARQQLAAIAKLWPGGSAPRVHDVVVLEQRGRVLESLLAQALDGLYSLGPHPRKLIDEALIVGVPLPTYLTEDT